jgi:hypothetical protein
VEEKKEFYYEMNFWERKLFFFGMLLTGWNLLWDIRENWVTHIYLNKVGNYIWELQFHGLRKYCVHTLNKLMNLILLKFCGMLKMENKILKVNFFLLQAPHPFHFNNIINIFTDLIN